jgi:hypothetical protein
MTTAVQPATAVNLSDIAAGWREARRLYPIYAALIRAFDIGVKPNKELESPINRAEPEALARIARWLDDVDSKCEVWQLRQVLQTAGWVSDEQLRSLTRRHLTKTKRDARVRDKVDYLLVQYYAHHAPEDAHNTHLTFEHVAELIGDLTGQAKAQPAFSADLEKILADLNGCKSLQDLIGGKVIERSRAVKEKAGDGYFEASSLVAFARFNFLLRLGFFRLMHADLHAIRYAIHAMEQRGQSVCDCSPAGLSKEEPLAKLREICHDWKKPFRAAYSAAVNFKQIIDLRKAVEAATKAPAPALKATKPAVKVEEPAPMATSKVEVPAASPKRLTVEQVIEQIAERLHHTAIKNASVTNLMFGELKVMLASWEVGAYTHGGDDASDSLQRAVAARVALQIAMEQKKTSHLVDMTESLGSAHAEAARLQEKIAEAKEQKNIDAAVNLAATSKRLISLIAEAEKLG